jgi:tRNA-dihydrouridine synthase C
MEGVIDYEMRDILTQRGGYHRCVTEFIRVTNQILPEKVFRRFSPELNHGGTTASGVPVYLQLLGGSPKFMGLNAARAQTLEPPGIDINFGCPSKTVTRNEGGSVLLKEPERIGDIVAAVRDSVDPKIPVTAKIRLGFSSHDYLDEVADRIVDGGATELCIHARTRDDRYKPPAYWSAVKNVARRISIPVIINGEIWNAGDAIQAQQKSGCKDIMLGRGALTCPDIAARIEAEHTGSHYEMMSWAETLDLIVNYLSNSTNKHPRFTSNRLKQWLVFLQRHYPQAGELFQLVKRLKTRDEVFEHLGQYQKRLNHQRTSD